MDVQVPSQTRRSLLLGGVLAAAFAPQASSAAAALALQERLAGLRRFIGRWRGEGEGDPGRSRVQAQLRGRTGWTVPAREEYLYPCAAAEESAGRGARRPGAVQLTRRASAPLRQFHVEGFVNRMSRPRRRGRRGAEPRIGGHRERSRRLARETYAFSGADVLETFELAEPWRISRRTPQRRAAAYEAPGARRPAKAGRRRLPAAAAGRPAAMPRAPGARSAAGIRARRASSTVHRRRFPASLPQQ
jgi:hypothetical protein